MKTLADAAIVTPLAMSGTTFAQEDRKCHLVTADHIRAVSFALENYTEDILLGEV
jgi:hypothetical protein